MKFPVEVLCPKINSVHITYYMAKSEVKTCSGKYNQQSNTHICIHVTHCNCEMASCLFTMFSELSDSGQALAPTIINMLGKHH